MDWGVASEIFDEVIVYPVERREAELQKRTSDPATLRLVRRMLDASERETGFMEFGAAEDRPPKFETGQRVGVWAVDRLLGSGGMGEVYLVRRADGQYEQTAALKLLKVKTAISHDRFARERQILARLEHPNLARLIDGGVLQDDLPYFVMEHVEGRHITDYAAEKSIGRDDRLALFHQVLDALNHAHGRLVLHRDLKPSNVLVTDSGQVKVIDFGVAAALSENEADLNAPMSRAYAAPEQLSGETVTAATDVYGAAILLCELLTGEPPQREDLSRSISALPADLQAILKKATANDPGGRYGSVQAMKDDLENFASHRPVDARKGGSGYRLGRFFRRYRTATVLTGLLVLALGVGLGGTIYMAAEAERERDIALDALAEAEYQTQQYQFYSSLNNGSSFAYQRAFADDDLGLTADQLKASLLRTVEQTVAVAEQAPDRSAYTLAAIGRIFVFRNDYPSAITAFEAFMDLEVDDTLLMGMSETLLAQAYQNTGQLDKAEPLIRSALEKVEGTREEFTASHASKVVMLAYVTRNETDIDAAITVIEKAIEAEEARVSRGEIAAHNTNLSYLYGALGNMGQLKGDVDLAVSSWSRDVEIKRAAALIEPTDTDTSIMRLARATLYYQEDLDRSAVLIDELIDFGNEQKGESLRLGQSYALKADLELAQGNYDAAIAAADLGAPLIVEYGSQADPIYYMSQASKAEALASLGRMDEAMQVLSDAVRLREAQSADTSDAETTLMLTKGILSALFGDTEVAAEIADRFGPDISATSFNRPRLDRLQAVLETP